MHQKRSKLFLTMLCAAAVLTAGISFQSKADTEAKAPSSVRIYGTVNQAEKDRISIARQDGDFAGQELIITISDETRVLDAVTGFGVAPDTLKSGDPIYAYISPAMTLSLPPMSHGEMILCNIPADFKVPDYITVENLSLNSDGVSGTIQSADGATYTIPADCQILPYLTRNIEVLQNLTKGRTCLIWTDAASNNAYKIVAFARSASDASENAEGPGGTVKKFGWAEKDGNWYFYGQNGLQKGWLQDGGDWYYLDPDTGAMKTGFLTVNGQTYYLNSDGRMLTAPKTFTPDENGALH